MNLPNIGIALGGGGARGAAHIGVLQVLQEENIEIDIISGVSAGSVIGAMYAHKKDPAWIESRLRKALDKYPFRNKYGKYFRSSSSKKSFFLKTSGFIFNHIFNTLKLHKNSIIKKKHLEDVISFLVPSRTFQELKIPIKIGASDLNSGETVVYEDGDLITAIVQSCSIPGIIEPTIKGEKILVDGGVTSPIPVSMIKEDCMFTIAVDISQSQFSNLEKINMLELKGRADLITSNELKLNLSKKANFVIRPNTLGLHWSSFHKFESLILEGKNVTNSSIINLKNLLPKKINNYSGKEWLG